MVSNLKSVIALEKKNAQSKVYLSVSVVVAPPFTHARHNFVSLSYSKDARLPVQLQRAMAAEAEAAREARAKVIAAEGEQKASRALKEASEVIAESSSALQLRYLQASVTSRNILLSA